jgi:stress response protein YsnF
MSHTVIGIFEQNSEALQAKQSLIDLGFSSDNIDVNTSGYSDSMTTGTTAVGSETHKDKDDDSIAGFFRNLFSSDDDDDDERNKYIEAGRRGTIVTVHARSSEEAEQAAELLDRFGAVDVDEYAGRLNASGTTGSGSVTDSSVTDSTVDTDKIQVIEEDMEVGKREVETGGVRLHSRIIERPVEESIRLRTERVTVERTPVDRPATEADFNAFQEGTVEVTETTEIPVVSKDARVVEEIKLGKEVEENEETIKGTVRSTEVRTEDIQSDETKKRTDLDL